MLKMVLGRSGYGKTEYVFNRIKNLVMNGEDNILLITPEQYSLVCERRLLSDLGESSVSLVENSSFSRINDDVKRKFGGETLPVLSKGGKTVLMQRAIEESKDSLCLFSKKLDSLSFVDSMIRIYDEMKSCNLNADEISVLSDGIKNDSLRRKLADITLIMKIYENLIENRFLDPADELTRLYHKIKNLNYFKGKKVFIDAFNGFVAQEYKILELIISEADEVTITLCADLSRDDSFSLFSYVNNSARIIEKIAVKAGVEITYKNLETNYRAKNDDIKNAEKNIFSQSPENCFLSDCKVKIYNAKTITDECCEVSRQIRKLLRNGYKASEIAVITRDTEKYRDEIESAFRKYEIPFYNDERQPVKTHALVVFVEYLLRCINYSFRSDDILSLAKTGLTGITDKEINALENYIYLWNINGLKWTEEFKNSTKGFVNEINKNDRIALDSINNTRKKLIEPLLLFKNSVKGADAKGICEQIYYALINFGADEKLRNNAVELAEMNCISLAQQQGQIWDLLMNILDELPKTLGNEKMNLRDFARLFSLIISAEDTGTLPAGIDNVQFGQADRIRTENPRAVFIIGANEGEFPGNVTGGGLLSENDRRILLENDFKLYSYSEILNLQERYFAYMACACASENLFVSYIGNTGKDSAPSEIAVSLKNIFNNLNEYSFSDISDIDLVETYSNSFELMSENYLTNTEFYSSLKKYFENDPRYSAIKSLAENKDAAINNKNTATSLFDYNMYVSASRLEDYYNCPFRYFCKFGLNAKPRKKAEIDPMQRGTLIHYVLEMILANYGSKKLSQMSRSEMVFLVDKYISEYFESEMGNASDLTQRFKYNYRRLAKLIYSVIFHLSEEFRECDFEAQAFELLIDRDGKVKPEILALDDGGTIQIRGSIDRVDTFVKDGETYVRVVDYKSGNKDFCLSDIMYGLNLQMFVYLFSLCADKKAELSGTPAGVLYMHAARNIFSFSSKREANQSITGEETSSFKMKGIVLSDDNGEIPQAMEHELEGKYIPVKMKKGGELSGQLASLEELGLIHKKVNSLISQMGTELHLGKISRNPVKNKTHKNTCEYCDYADVCANKRNIEHRVTDDLSNSEVKEILLKEFAEDATVDTTTE